MAVFSYERYKIRVAADSHKAQGLKAGDIVRRQYADRMGTVYSLMAVLDSGVDVIEEKESPYFIGALLEGDAPRNGELLDFVRVTSLLSPERSGALYLTASDSESPFLDVLDGMATEQSLCYPLMADGILDLPDKKKYAISGNEYVAVSYTVDSGEALRVVKLCRNSAALPPGEIIGLKQTLEEPVEHPQRLLISFRVRACRPLKGVPLQFGYTNGEKTDAKDTIDVGTAWEYKLWVITVEYPRSYSRSFLFDLRGHLREEGDWCEIGDLNIVRLSSVASFTGSTKARVGKVSGIVDPVYGVLEGYGAYFQHLYATRDVNIAGTLTAGDRNGFSSAFYVGKIHKNVLVNSLGCCFSGATEIGGVTPPGIGKAVRLAGESVLQVQSGQWREAHIGQSYCFSLWIKAEDAGRFSLYQDEHYLQDIEITAIGEWQRQKVSFFIRSSVSQDMSVGLRNVPAGLCVTAPQLESGNTPTPYQGTDEVLSYVEDYGAWFCRGGVGGTIQNPLLRLNGDGSISSRDGSFVINPDGTGHFAGGRFKWTKDTIELRDFTIRWEDLDEAAWEELKPRYVTVSGGNVFHYPNDWDEGVCEPSQITIVGTEHNFEGTGRFWEYLGADGEWKDAGCHAGAFILKPDFHGWEEREILSLRYTAVMDERLYSGSHTVFKQSDGASAYSVCVESDNGTIFRGGVLSTVLRARVYRGGVEITDEIPQANFQWRRISRDEQQDTVWNSADHRGRTIEIGTEDVRHKAVFDCEVLISKNS